MDIGQLLHFLKGLGFAKTRRWTFAGSSWGVRREVSEAEFADARGGRVTVSVWNRAC